MQRHQFTVGVPVPAATVEALLGSYPTTWLRRFLRLASLAASERPGGPTAPGWYRLAPPERNEAGRLVAPMMWWPHAGDILFESFRGEFVVTTAAEDVRLELVGGTDGGDEDTNAEVLRSVVELIGAALRAAHPPEG